MIGQAMPPRRSRRTLSMRDSPIPAAPPPQHRARHQRQPAGRLGHAPHRRRPAPSQRPHDRAGVLRDRLEVDGYGRGGHGWGKQAAGSGSPGILARFGARTESLLSAMRLPRLTHAAPRVGPGHRRPGGDAHAAALCPGEGGRAPRLRPGPGISGSRRWLVTPGGIAYTPARVSRERGSGDRCRERNPMRRTAPPSRPKPTRPAPKPRPRSRTRTTRRKSPSHRRRRRRRLEPRPSLRPRTRRTSSTPFPPPLAPPRRARRESSRLRWRPKPPPAPTGDAARARAGGAARGASRGRGHVLGRARADRPLDPDRRRRARHLGRPEARAAAARRARAGRRLARAGAGARRGPHRRARGAARRRARRPGLALLRPGHQRRRRQPHRRGDSRRSRRGCPARSARCATSLGQVDGAETRQRLARLELDARRARRPSSPPSRSRSRPASPPAAGEEAAQQVDVYRAELEGLRAEMGRLSDEVQGLGARVDEVEAERRPADRRRRSRGSTRSRPSADTALSRAELDADLALVRAAIAGGLPFERAARPHRRAARRRRVPDGLTAAAGTGVMTLPALRDAFPDAAHAAIRASIVAGAGDGVVARGRAFLAAQVASRSLTPQTGRRPGRGAVAHGGSAARRRPRGRARRGGARCRPRPPRRWATGSPRRGCARGGRRPSGARRAASGHQLRGAHDALVAAQDRRLPRGSRRRSPSAPPGCSRRRAR